MTAEERNRAVVVIARILAELAVAPVSPGTPARERLDFRGPLGHAFVERGLEVAVVRGEDDEVDVVALGLPDDGKRAQHVDALLALARDDPQTVGPEARPAVGVAFVAVLQRTVVHGDPRVAFLVGLLGLVAGVGLGVVLCGGLAAVDQDARQDGMIHTSR